jgi:hypothetical protein
MDDILMIYNQNQMHTDVMRVEFSVIQPTIKFTIENELDNQLNSDLTVHQKHNKLNFIIYKKTTSTDILNHNN